MSNLKDKWVLITGASSGFGEATARHFGVKGAKLLLGARRLNKLEKAAKAATNAGAPVALFHELDVSKTDSIEAFAKWVKSHTGKLDILVNNAGGAHGLEHVEKGRDQDWEAMLQINVLSVAKMCRAFIPMMKDNPGSMIINIGSIAARTPYENGAMYCAAKAGELAITKALRLELNGTGIRVGTIDPGLAETEFSMVRFKGDAEKAKKVYAGVTPLTADDVAEAIVWAADRPPHVNIDEMVIKCTDQAEIYKTHRRES